MSSTEGYLPLRVTARLGCGVIADGFLPLDGALHYQDMRVRLGPELATLPGASTSDDPAGRTTIPLQRIHRNPHQWVYACSFARWSQPVVAGQDSWNKRLDAAHLDLVAPARKGRINTAEGVYRAYHMPVTYYHSLWLEWYVVGDPGRLWGLLRLITHLGKKTAQGWGRVVAWTVEPWPHDWSLVGPDGALMRACPGQPPARSHWATQGVYGYRPSYWKPYNQTTVALPAPFAPALGPPP